METKEIVKWIEEKITFIRYCQNLITEVNVFNETVVEFGKKYYRIYIEIVADLPEIKKPLGELTSYEYQITFFSTIRNYIYFPAKGIDENNVALHYDWISECCKIHLKNPPFKLDIKNYFKDPNKYFSQFD
jgi:hypothetical protein